MILHVLDENLTYKGRLESYRSLSWKEQYQGEGGFTLIADDTERNAALLSHGNLLYRADRKTAMHIVNVVRSTAQKAITASGYTELCLLDRRAMQQPFTVSNAEKGIYDVLNDNLRELPVETGDLAGFEEVWDGVLEEMALSDAAYSVCKYSGLGVKMLINVNNKKRILSVYRGQNKTYSPETGGRVFSQEYGNLRGLTVTEDDDLYKNVAVVRGLGQDEKLKEIVVGNASGLERREMLVKVPTQGTKQTNAEYLAEMKSAGEQALLKQRRVQTFEAEISPKDFGTAYDLGDLVTCNSKRYGLRFNQRITEFTQTVENGVSKIVLTLGEPTISYAESITGKGNTVTGSGTANVALSAYPVGSIYLSISSQSPSELFGGTWERLKDTFLLAAGNTYEAGSEGGEATHTLTIEEMPSHSHVERVPVQGVGYKHWTGGTAIKESETVYRIPTSSLGSLSSAAVLSTETSGGGQPHNNMPPYIAVYMWKRTA